MRGGWLLCLIYEGSDLTVGVMPLLNSSREVQLGNYMLKQLDGLGCWVCEFKV